MNQIKVVAQTNAKHATPKAISSLGYSIIGVVFCVCSSRAESGQSGQREFFFDSLLVGSEFIQTSRRSPSQNLQEPLRNPLFQHLLHWTVPHLTHFIRLTLANQPVPWPQFRHSPAILSFFHILVHKYTCQTRQSYCSAEKISRPLVRA